MQQKYKVFLNERYIEISRPVNIKLNNPYVMFGSDADAKDVKKWFNSFVSSKLKEIKLFHQDPDGFFRVFQSAYIRIPAAGGVVVSGEHILFILRRGVWDLPKGKIDKNEEPSSAAIREVKEECGISGHEIVKVLPTTYHIYFCTYPGDRKKWIFKETIWFEMKYNGPLIGFPEVKEGITEIKWFPKSELNRVSVNTYENLKQIIDLYK